MGNVVKNDGKKYYEKKVLPFIKRLKDKTERYIAKGKFNRALDNISVASCILYKTNQYLFDEKTEEYISQISKNFVFSPSNPPEKKKVLFYDGFGLDRRGLAGIYLKCLSRQYEVVYCTLKRHKNHIPTLLNILGENTETYYIDEKSYTQIVKDVSEIIKKENPSDMFIYVSPFDVAAITAFTAYNGDGKRYLINLTDHAFWLGHNSYDRLIEFRDYGTYLSVSERGVKPDKVVKIPMYPEVKTDVDFMGYPFPFDDKTQKLFFSGGALYKTVGKDGKYYSILKNILTECPETVFWYAGEGDDGELNKVKYLFPNRVYHTAERKDLYQLLKKCAFYLSTYPICGNMMTQYAAAAGRVPLTLKNGNDGSGTLLGQDKLNFEFEDENALIEEAKKLVRDDNYRENRKADFINSVMREENFNNALINLIEKDEKVFAVETSNFIKDDFAGLYLEQIDFPLIADCVAKKGRKSVFDFPIYYFAGCLIKAIRKFKRNK